MLNKKTYFISGGGTGGHIYPAVSVINSLIEDGVDNSDIYYIGNDKNLEYEIASKNKFQFLSYKVNGMPRKFSPKFVLWLIALFLSTFKAIYYVIKYRPSVIFATGGYVCAPILFAGLFLNVPFVLHDCDVQPGIVTRFFAPFAKSVSTAFEGASKKIKSKNIHLNGNPIRHEFVSISKKQAREELSIKDDFTILIMGGSLGARNINNSAFKILREYANKEGFKIIWQTGKKNFDDVVKKIMQDINELPDNLILQPYYDRMYLALLASDIVISRAGSLSLSEICASSLPSILVPYPYASGNHQKKNAQEFVDKKIALMIEDKDCNEETLFKLLDETINNKKLLSDLSYNAFKNAKLSASSMIVEQINDAIKR